MSTDFRNQDTERHVQAAQFCKDKRRLNSHNEFWLSCNGHVKVAKRVVTRSPNPQSQDIWLLSHMVKNAADSLVAAGFNVVLLLVDTDPADSITPRTLTEVLYEEIKARLIFVNRNDKSFYHFSL